MKYVVSDEERRLAKHPHEIFLVNLITNHILVFVALLGLANSYPLLLLAVPAISAAILLYLLWRAARVRATAPWFVMVHWQLAARRAGWFIGILALMALALLLVVWVAGGAPGPQHYAIGGVAMLPAMLAVLTLIILESEGVHQAGHGMVPRGVAARYPDGAARPLEEGE